MALESHKAFPQPSGPSERAWRYMDLAKFVALLLRKELHFTRLDCLEDKFEGTLPLQFRQAILDQVMRPLTVEQAKPYVEKFLRFMNRMYAGHDVLSAPKAGCEDEHKAIVFTAVLYMYVQLSGYVYAMQGLSFDRNPAAAKALEDADVGMRSALSQLADRIKDPMIETLRDIECNQERMSPEELENGIRRFADFLVSKIASMRKQLYVSCWHLGDWESEAMWRIYCGRGDGLAVVLPYERLRDSLTYPNTHMGKVAYVDYNNLEQFQIADAFFSVALHKRKEFGHEEEVRIVHLDVLSSDDERPQALDVSWDVESAIEAIVISPYAKSWYTDVVKGVVERVAPKLAGKVKISSMGGSPAQ